MLSVVAKKGVAGPLTAQAHAQPPAAKPTLSHVFVFHLFFVHLRFKLSISENRYYNPFIKVRGLKQPKSRRYLWYEKTLNFTL